MWNLTQLQEYWFNCMKRTPEASATQVRALKKDKHLDWSGVRILPTKYNFPGGPVAKTPCSQCRAPGFPGRQTGPTCHNWKIPCVPTKTLCSQINKYIYIFKNITKEQSDRYRILKKDGWNETMKSKLYEEESYTGEKQNNTWTLRSKQSKNTVRRLADWTAKTEGFCNRISEILFEK